MSNKRPKVYADLPEQVRNQWSTMSAIEEDNRAVVRRDLNAYATILKGLAHFLDYVERVPESNTVVDIGAGQAVAVSQLAELYAGRQLNFLATGIVVPKDSPPEVPYLKTGAETLYGIDSKSVAGALAVHSIIFSAAPDMVVNSLDRVLVDGGVIKTNLVLNQSGSYVPSTQGALRSEFVSAGYDVALDPSGKVLLAMKPGGESVVDANTLLHADLESRETQQSLAEVSPSIL